MRGGIFSLATNAFTEDEGCKTDLYLPKRHGQIPPNSNDIDFPHSGGENVTLPSSKGKMVMLPSTWGNNAGIIWIEIQITWY